MSSKAKTIPAARAPISETVFSIWQRANAARALRTQIDDKVLREPDKLAARWLEQQMDFLLEYSTALDLVASFNRATDLHDAMAHLSICHCDLDALIGSEPSPDDDATVERVFRLVSSVLAVVARAAGHDLSVVTGERGFSERIDSQFVEVAA